MSVTQKLSAAIQDTRYIPAIGRVLAAAIFLNGGLGKALAPAGVERYIASAGLPFPTLGLIIAIVIEIGGGTLLLLGYRARLVAIILAAFTIVTALIFHSDFGNQNQVIHFMKNLAIAGGLLQVAAFGGGSLSIDAKRSPPAALRSGGVR
ncbi:DoxX family protein [Roseomonas hellenica]|uniref:DoxX family protein n=1 Tax=Plastoroseomonas hellenica TaxID=2687306 RepID=A0ABS5EUF2_9PROT|nr:DoxX family protein [Plastoroseomonas hellenica]MBR0663922.1 DoxX family protein [Plastoroseomonas hellenica]